MISINNPAKETDAKAIITIDETQESRRANWLRIYGLMAYAYGNPRHKPRDHRPAVQPSA
ncbi:hypothetical protein [Vulcanisaeta souniana]|uniref:Uncharacterized protein n=1 Tax=Vulcanisaeta souniana JCM 11219 TaxID=1293586 RepID=A0A830EM55_9CREN|nr:hypothetical protein [Vulcanisaeta souniana]GGI84506.1 hypothetical protein GCM10007112_21870 [Vulcanisaeta souniana JCM 11219]